MIKNFDLVKSQLSDLAGVINSFKSEAVQLRIIELILGKPQDTGSSDSTDNGNAPAKRIVRRRKTKAKGTQEPSTDKKRKPASRSGPSAMLTELLKTDFFDKPRTSNDIITYCKEKQAKNFKANELSPGLGRMVRKGELTRNKDKDGHYEYKKS